MTTDEEAEAFLESDLSDIDFAQFKTARFEFPEKPKGAKRRGESAMPVAAEPQFDRIAPGTPAPKSGVYQQTGPRGGRRRERAISNAGKPLPPAPAGRSWTLIDQTPRKHHK